MRRSGVRVTTRVLAGRGTLTPALSQREREKMSGSVPFLERDAVREENLDSLPPTSAACHRDRHDDTGGSRESVQCVRPKNMPALEKSTHVLQIDSCLKGDGVQRFVTGMDGLSQMPAERVFGSCGGEASVLQFHFGKFFGYGLAFTTNLKQDLGRYVRGFHAGYLLGLRTSYAVTGKIVTSSI